MASHFSQPATPTPQPEPQPQDEKSPELSYSRDAAASYAEARKNGGRRDSGGSRRGRIVALVIVAVLAVILVAGGTMGFMLYQSAMQVKDDASAVMAQASTLSDGLKGGNAEELSDSVGVVVEKVNAINEEVHTPLWDFATIIPVVGEDIRSVQTLGSAAHSLVNDALVPVTNSISGMKLSDLFQDGAVNVGLIQAISGSLSAATPVIQESLAQISSLPEAHIPQLRDVLSRVQEPISQVQGVVDQLQPILDVLPQMLGANGQTRTYLIIAQNNAELRATGGLPGSWGTISVTDGVISMGEFVSILHDPGLEVQITDDEVAAIATNMNTDPAQVNCTPDFERVGQLAREYWIQKGFGEVNGVVAIDPVFLQRLLALTGGFTASDGEAVDGSNAAEVLLSGTYWKFGNDGDAQDEYFSSVASLAFEQVMNHLGDADMKQLLEVFDQSAKDGRLLVWMENGDEQALVEELGASGKLETDPTKPVLGFYINDDTYSKISWYASTSTTVGEGVKNADGTTTYDVTSTLTNTITPEISWSAPRYVIGTSGEKRDPSDMIMYLFLFAPVGGSITDLNVSEGGLVDGFGIATASLNGLQVYRMRAHALAGETVTLTYKVTTSAEATEPLAVRTTPLAQESLMN